MVSKEEVNHLLELARLEISEEEKEKLTLDVDKILEYVNTLSGVDVKDVKLTLGGSLNTNVTREDTIREENFSRETLINDIPERNGNLVAVPNIFNDEN